MTSRGDMAISTDKVFYTSKTIEGRPMGERKHGCVEEPETISGQDPLGVRRTMLGGDPHSLFVEARIAARQWAAKNGHPVKREVSSGPEEEV